eukprot:767554-Hanusia_phi.AAC.6
MATTNGEPVLNYTSSVHGGYEPALQSVVAKFTNSLEVNKESWNDVALDGSVGLQLSPHASLTIIKDRKTLLLAREILEADWNSLDSQLVCSAQTSLSVPDAQFDLSSSLILTLTLNPRGAYSASIALVEKTIPQMKSLARRSAPQRAIFEVRASLVVYGSTGRNFEDFIRNFAVAQTKLETEISISRRHAWGHGQDVVSRARPQLHRPGDDSRSGRPEDDKVEVAVGVELNHRSEHRDVAACHDELATQQSWEYD